LEGEDGFLNAAPGVTELNRGKDSRKDAAGDKGDDIQFRKLDKDFVDGYGPNTVVFLPTRYEDAGEEEVAEGAIGEAPSDVFEEEDQVG